MHYSGEFPEEPSRFILPPSPPEGPAEQAELRGLFFATIEDSLDIAAILDHQDLAAFHAQLRYARLLSSIGEPGRAAGQFELAVAAAEAGVAHDDSPQEGIEAPEFLRNQAVTLAAVAAALHGSGRHEQAEPLISQAVDKLEQGLFTMNTPGLHIPDMHRTAREQSAKLAVAGSLADMGRIDQSEAWRKRAFMDGSNYEQHMDVLERQKQVVAEGSPEAFVIGGMQDAIMRSVRETIIEVLTGESEETVEVRHITKLHHIAEEYAQDIVVTDLLDAYTGSLDSTAPAREQEEAYRRLADAYELTDDPDATYLALARALPFIRARIREGKVEALEDLAVVQLHLRDDEEAERTMLEIELRYRLEVRREQAQLAITDKDPEKAVRVLNTAMQELELRFETAGSDEDEYETGMGLDYVDMYGKLGEYDRMNEAYELLERHNEAFGPWNAMVAGNQSAHPPIARCFLTSGRVDRAFDAIRYADDISQARFLIGLMETVCAPEPTIKAMLIDRAQLATELKDYASYLKEQRES